MSRVALVTAGAKGIGLATARALADSGHRVAVTYRSGPPPAADAERFLCVPADVTSRPSVDAAFDQVEAELGPVEVLVANAGTTNDGLAVRMSDTDFADVIDANLVGSFRCARRATQRMLRARWGRIVLIGSVSGSLGQAGQANYAASKAGLVGMARSLARELASRNITVNVVAPGPVATDLLQKLPEDRLEAMRQAVPIGRFVAAEEVAAAVAYLASDGAAATTGAVIPVDGGLGMGAW